MSQPQPPTIPPVIYATLTGIVDASMVQRVFAAGAPIVNSKVKTVHLLIQSTGGGIGDGIALYNYLRNLPIELVTYNVGQVSSIAVLIYLSGKRRLVNKSATFMLHKSTMTLITPAPVEQLQRAAQGLSIEDARSEAILHEHLPALPPELWERHERGELTLTAEESVTFGLAHELGDFAPPAGSSLSTV